MAEDKLELDWGNEKLKRAQNQTEENPYDLEAWSLLIREAQGRWIGEMRPLFERLIQVFPSAGRYWKIYIELEMRARNFERVEKVCVNNFGLFIKVNKIPDFFVHEFHSVVLLKTWEGAFSGEL